MISNFCHHRFVGLGVYNIGGIRKGSSTVEKNGPTLQYKNSTKVEHVDQQQSALLIFETLVH